MQICISIFSTPNITDVPTQDDFYNIVGFNELSEVKHTLSPPLHRSPELPPLNFFSIVPSRSHSLPKRVHIMKNSDRQSSSGGAGQSVNVQPAGTYKITVPKLNDTRPGLLFSFPDDCMQNQQHTSASHYFSKFNY